MLREQWSCLVDLENGMDLVVQKPYCYLGPRTLLAVEGSGVGVEDGRMRVQREAEEEAGVEEAEVDVVRAMLTSPGWGKVFLARRVELGVFSQVDITYGHGFIMIEHLLHLAAT